jgi:hypothetical protein
VRGASVIGSAIVSVTSAMTTRRPVADVGASLTGPL